MALQQTVFSTATSTTLLVLVFLFLITGQQQHHRSDHFFVQCLSLQDTTLPTSSRKDFLHKVIPKMAQRGAVLSASMFLLPSPNVQAACLSGDTSPECIGVYKVPLEEAARSEMLNSKEALERNAPGLKFVVPTQPPPANYSQAREVLLAQREAARDIQQVVANGKLEEAGIKLLNLVPRVTSSGRVLVEAADSSVRAQFLQQRLDLVIALYSEADVMMGQGLRGQMGSITVAQLNIIKQLQEAASAFDDLLQMIPE